jgi:hypothetical protein
VKVLAMPKAKRKGHKQETDEGETNQEREYFRRITTSGTWTGSMEHGLGLGNWGWDALAGQEHGGGRCRGRRGGGGRWAFTSRYLPWGAYTTVPKTQRGSPPVMRYRVSSEGYLASPGYLTVRWCRPLVRVVQVGGFGVLGLHDWATTEGGPL